METIPVITTSTDALPVMTLLTLEDIFDQRRQKIGAFPVEEISPLDVMVVYEDKDCGLRVKDALRRVNRQSGVSLRMNIKLWKVELFAIPTFRERAAMEAARASIVFLSLHGQRSLPQIVRLFLEDWIARKGAGTSSAFMVLLETDESNPAGLGQSVLPYLQNVAQRGGLDFLFEFCEQPEVKPQAPAIKLHRQTRERAYALDDILQLGRSFQRGGINE